MEDSELRDLISTLQSSLGYPNGELDIDEIAEQCWDDISENEISDLILKS